MTPRFTLIAGLVALTLTGCDRNKYNRNDNTYPNDNVVAPRTSIPQPDTRTTPPSRITPDTPPGDRANPGADRTVGGTPSAAGRDQVTDRVQERLDTIQTRIDRLRDKATDAERDEVQSLEQRRQAVDNQLQSFRGGATQIQPTDLSRDVDDLWADLQSLESRISGANPGSDAPETNANGNDSATP